MPARKSTVIKKRGGKRLGAGRKPGAGKRVGAYQPEFAAQAEKLCELGATDADLAEFFGVSDRTIYRWRASVPAFCHALKAGKISADERVVRALYHRAVGFSHEAVKIFMVASGKTKTKKPVLVPYREQVPPDTTAAIFWLKNRQRELWRDTTINEMTGKDGGPVLVKEDISPLEAARRIAFAIELAAREAAKKDKP